MRVAIFFAAVVAFAQGPAFEVASIKAHALPPGALVDYSASGPRVQYRAFPILSLVMEAYNLKREFVAFASRPADADTVYYTIAAKAERDGARTRSEFRAMLRTLLADRFHLKVHEEERETPVYALVVAKGGPKLKASGDGEPRFLGGVNGRNQYIEAKKMTLEQLTSHLTDFLGVDRPVVDRTGLRGEYDIRVEATPAFRRDSEPGDLNIFTAVQEQLGLKLEPAKALLKVLVVDHVEKPSDN